MPSRRGYPRPYDREKEPRAHTQRSQIHAREQAWQGLLASEPLHAPHLQLPPVLPTHSQVKKRNTTPHTVICTNSLPDFVITGQSSPPGVSVLRRLRRFRDGFARVLGY